MTAPQSSAPKNPALKKGTSTISPRRRALLAKVHIAKKQLGLPDDAYRTILVTKFPGKESAKRLTDSELTSLVAHFEQRGFSPAVRGKRKPGSSFRTESKRPMVRKIYVLWSILHEHGGYTAKRPDGFVQRMTKTEARPDGIANTEWLDDEEAWTIIEALKKIIHRNDLGGYLVD